MSLIIIYCYYLCEILKNTFCIDLFYLPQGHQLYGWDNNFTEKWKDLAASKPLNQTATVDCDFPTFNTQNIVLLYWKKAKDNDSNKDYKNISSQDLGLFRHGHIKNWKSLGTTMRRHIFDVIACLK